MSVQDEIIIVPVSLLQGQNPVIDLLYIHDTALGYIEYILLLRWILLSVICA